MLEIAQGDEHEIPPQRLPVRVPASAPGGRRSSAAGVIAGRRTMDRRINLSDDARTYRLAIVDG
ncbi:hypothetical protein [Promicromonospora sp. NPDC057488]|uniref:hypothetical protein n=1 Tax=Promicromonospora sp. NPDC057488 TaxID=3346147 RepID=UPI00366EF160